MNPDQNRGGMTINGLLQALLVASLAIPIIVLAVPAALALISETPTNQSTLLSIIIACAAALLLLVFIVNYIVQRKIKDRISELVEVCRDYIGGDRMVRSTVSGDDEFSQVAMALNTILDNQGTGANVALGAGGSDAAALQAQIEKLLQEVSAVGDGDLRVQAEVTPDTLGVLADSFNYMIEELAKVVGRVQSTAVQVTNATRRILDRSAELAQASETQVAQISQTTEAVEALASFIQDVARNAQLSVDVAQEALRNAANGQQAVRQTIDGMMLIRENVQETSKKIKRLGERSNEIGEIVRIIEDIADQTNLLALNAAIQSAMAGEHGRGFAVVADEIRLLAERSTESTKRIATLVKSIQGDTYEAVVAMEDSTQEVVKGSQLADDAGRSLNSIYSAVERQAQMIENIARAANDQTTVSEAVAVAMGRISEITRQTDAGTQEAAVSVSYLAELSEQLRASVSTFRLPERGNDMSGSFSSVSSITDMPDGSNAQMFSSSAMDNDWGQNFSGNFPPLPEPGNSGSLVPMSARPAQLGAPQQDFGQPAAFGGQSFGQQPAAFGGQSFGQQPAAFGGQQFGNQQQFMPPPNYGDQSAFASQPPNNGFGAQQFGNQDFGDMGNFEDQQGFNGGNWYSGQQFGAQPNFGDTGSNQMLPPNSALLPPPQTGQPAPRQQRWSGGLQQNPNQFSFNPDQRPFRDNG